MVYKDIVSARENIAKRYSIISILLFVGGVTHAILFWPIRAAIAVFLGGMIIVFVAEVIVAKGNLVIHHVEPKFVDVPIYVLFGWPATVYILFRLALFVGDGMVAVGLTGIIAVLYDIPTEQNGLEHELWEYTEAGRGPQFNGVPWWNFAGWFVISAVTASLALPFL